MDENTITSKQYIYGLFQSEHWKHLAKSISENASYTKSISQECLNIKNNDHHDIKNISMKKVLSVLNSMYSIKLPESPLFHRVGSRGLNDWIWSTQIQGHITSSTILEYLEMKKSCKPTTYLALTQFSLKLVQFFKTKLNLKTQDVHDEHLTNKAILIEFVNTYPPNRIEKNLLSVIYKQLLPHEIEIEELKTRSSKHRALPINHPAIQAHMENLLRSGVKIHSINVKYKLSYSKFLNWLHKNYVDFQHTQPDSIPLSRVTETHLLEFKSYLLKLASSGKCSKQTASNHLYDIRYLFSNLYKMGWLTKDITLNVTGIRYDPYHYRNLPTDTDLQHFFEAIEQFSDQPEVDRVAFGLMVWLGLRIHEVGYLRRKDINIDNRTISIFGKNEKCVLLPIPEPLLQWLTELLETRPNQNFIISENRKSFTLELRDRYKLYAFVSDWKFTGGPHLLLHTFISRLSERQDCPPQMLMYLARHDRPENTVRYIHRSNAQLQRAINRIDYL
ncbi:tyrosine-type recombinase/integrase [Paenibacillus woosongensis]|uniref:Tyrosine-type recombinase/integrase n=1 Tax=Paenibacillus woosongensis TaxID=307580 RepID=A0AA95I5X1_9BACL|nr:site-specific integrase [Paenibacillus woosongensis]WHX47908.1 tyrosine-type recombinase/integrase [Paenibacillus woosongensis]